MGGTAMGNAGCLLFAEELDEAEFLESARISGGV
jgi:hypothetical protein